MRLKDNNITDAVGLSDIIGQAINSDIQAEVSKKFSGWYFKCQRLHMAKRLQGAKSKIYLSQVRSGRSYSKNTAVF